MFFNVSFEIATDAGGTIFVDDELVKELAEKHGVEIEDLDIYELWDMIQKAYPDYYNKAREEARANLHEMELGGISYIELLE